jgi:membrane-bound metal-dependent hydrolase YbcI (DUF457 family)
VDPITHGVASFALQRAFFPRISWRSVALIVVAGDISDIDWLSATLGPADYLRWHRTATHSLLFVAVLAILPILFRQSTKKAVGGPWAGFSWLAVGGAGFLHLFLDVLQADELALLWPFSSRRFALDVLPNLEPWLLTILIAAILLPELFLLVNEEIGSRTKRPRGRNGAIVGFTFMALYIGLRALLHANSVASLEAHTIGGEMPHRAAAFPDGTSPFLWHGVVETQSALNLVTMRSMGGEVSYASGVTTLHKPEPSPMLAAAQNSSAAVSFVRLARFPKAIVQTESEGYSVEIQDLKDQATEEKSHAISADITLDKNSCVISSELQWQRDSPGSR